MQANQSSKPQYLSVSVSEYPLTQGIPVAGSRPGREMGISPSTLQLLRVGLVGELQEPPCWATASTVRTGTSGRHSGSRTACDRLPHSLACTRARWVWASLAGPQHILTGTRAEYESVILLAHNTPGRCKIQDSGQARVVKAAPISTRERQV